MKVQIKSYKLNYIVLSLLLVMVTGTAQADFTEGLVHRWTFNDVNRPLVDDIGNVELINGGGITFEDGVAIFDGGTRSFLYSEDTRVNSDVLSDTKEFTIWVKFEVDSYPTELVRLIRRNQSARTDATTLSLSLTTNGQIMAAVTKDAGTYSAPRGTFSSSDSNNIAMGFSPSLIKCYSNGVQLVTALENQSINDIGVFTVGGLVEYNNRMKFSQVFIGRIDELRIYNRLLTLEELNSIEAVIDDNTPPESFQGAIFSPNPFSDEVRMAYHITEPGEIEISVYDESGSKVWYKSSEITETGYNEVVWDGYNKNGSPVQSGIYSCIVYMRNNGEVIPVASGTIVKKGTSTLEDS
jgi:hypothetical protein